MRRVLVGAVCVVTAVSLAAPASGLAKPPPPKKGHKVVPVVHLCAWLAASGGVSELKLEGSCKETHGHPKSIKTPYGSYTSTFYTARWGAEAPTLELVPHHSLSLGVAHITSSSSAVIGFFVKHERAKVLGNGVLVANKGVLATWAGETSSCHNPPTGDCTINEFESTKGTWAVVLTTLGAPPGSSGAEEKNESEGDDAEDLAQEELMKGPTVGVGLAITGHL
jgi:hypothetical protein